MDRHSYTKCGHRMYWLGYSMNDTHTLLANTHRYTKEGHTYTSEGHTYIQHGGIECIVTASYIPMFV